MSSTYQVALLNFTGPLDLLLQLIERSDVEITDIAVADVTSQYLDHIKQLPMLEAQELNQFLELAARLIYLKSTALLPLEAASEQDEELADLTEQLEQYRHYQAASRQLQKLLEGPEQAWPREIMTQLAADKLPLPDLTLTALEQAFQVALANVPAVMTSRDSISAVSLADMMRRTTKWLEEQTGPVSLDNYLATLRSRLELIVAFIATLELIRQQVIEVVQEQLFGSIMINYRGSHEAA